MFNDGAWIGWLLIVGSALASMLLFGFILPIRKRIKFPKPKGQDWGKVFWPEIRHKQTLHYKNFELKQASSVTPEPSVEIDSKDYSLIRGYRRLSSEDFYKLTQSEKGITSLEDLKEGDKSCST